MVGMVEIGDQWHVMKHEAVQKVLYQRPIARTGNRGSEPDPLIMPTLLQRKCNQRDH
jgi:hypothetical protein